MSLKSMFLALKESGTKCPNWGGGGNLDKIQNNSKNCFVKPSVMSKMASHFVVYGTK